MPISPKSDPSPNEAPNPLPADPLLFRLGQLSRLFVKLGTLGFGGPTAHMAMMSDEAVGRQQWLSADQFAEGITFCEMLPGPASTQLGIYIGYVRAGFLGALVAGLSFIGPAFVIEVVLSWAYFRFQSLPQLTALFFGVSPVVIAIVLGFCWKLGRKAVKDVVGVAIAALALLLSLTLGLSPLLLFLLAGLLGLWLYGPKRPPLGLPWLGLGLPLLGPGFLGANSVALATVLPPANFWDWGRLSEFWLPMTGFFLRVGSVIFGGGLVIIPLLEAEVVHQFQWLTPTEFINGIAIGQLSPGPVVLTAAFIGYKVAGVLGALVASVAIFTPSFAFIILGAPVLQRLRRNPWVQAALKGIKPAVLGVIAAAVGPLATAAFDQPTAIATIVAILLSLAALVALLRFRIATWQLVLVGAVVGLGAGLSLGLS